MAAKCGQYRYTRRFREIGIGDLALVGGKNASLGEMYRELSDRGVRVPNGFATTAQAYHHFLRENDLTEKIAAILADLDVADVDRLAAAGRRIRALIRAAELPDDLLDEIAAAYEELAEECGGDPDVAVRSSATAEDLPDASFAGQQETCLHIHGIGALLGTCRRIYASLYTNRAIAYRAHKGFAHTDVALSIGVQRMVRADRGAAGVMFTLDTESGFRDAVLITSAWGLGENVVQGTVNPDEFMVPFVRSVDEGRRVLERMAGNGLARGRGGLQVYFMCELPCNALRADAFLDLCDGFSIGSNDLTQLTLGVDRDSSLIEGLDERDPAVLALMDMAIGACRRRGKYVGICGQAPSDYPQITRWLVERGIDSISLNPDSLPAMTALILQTERQLAARPIPAAG